MRVGGGGGGSVLFVVGGFWGGYFRGWGQMKEETDHDLMTAKLESTLTNKNF